MSDTADIDRDIFTRTVEFLGGSKVLGRHIRTNLDIHDVIICGFKPSVLTALSEKATPLQYQEIFEKALGISVRTVQRYKKDLSGKRLSQEQSGRIWKFAEIFEKAADVLGSEEAAKEFLDRKAMGLGQRRPIDLLSTPAGVEMVETYLDQMKYGVYV